MNVTTSKQRTWGLFPQKGINGEYKRMKWNKSNVINSPLFSFILSWGINNKYIIINYLHGLFPLTLPHYPYFENMNYTNKLEDGE